MCDVTSGFARASVLRQLIAKRMWSCSDVGGFPPHAQSELMTFWATLWPATNEGRCPCFVLTHSHPPSLTTLNRFLRISFLQMSHSNCSAHLLWIEWRQSLKWHCILSYDYSNLILDHSGFTTYPCACILCLWKWLNCNKSNISANYKKAEAGCLTY